MTYYWPGVDTWYEDELQKTQVREYANRVLFQADAERAAAHGWSVVSVTELSQRAGCLRILTLGIFALVWRPKAKILVTFTRS